MDLHLVEAAAVQEAQVATVHQTLLVVQVV
jgi:hypothetical protein